jgi:polysaccharide pyruvyl transferase WcaK-like protein
MLNPDMDTTIYSGLTNEEIMENISKCEYLISMRLHAIIIGLLASVKTMCIDYDIKIEKIAKEFNLPLIDMKNDFGNRFFELKKQNLSEINNKVSLVDFDWIGVENAIK